MTDDETLLLEIWDINSEIIQLLNEMKYTILFTIIGDPQEDPIPQFPQLSCQDPTGELA